MRMNISVDIDTVTVFDGKVIIDVDPNQSDWFDAIMKAKNGVKLSELNPKDEFKIGDEVFIVLEQTENGTRVISKKFAYYNVEFGDSPDWKASPIRKALNNDYFNKISAIVGEKNILSMDRKLTSLDGINDYGSCSDKVSLLTSSEFAKYRKIISSKSSYSDWWWLITPASAPSHDVCCARSAGVLTWIGCNYRCVVRPCLNLESSISVLLNKD